MATIMVTMIIMAATTDTTTVVGSTWAPGQAAKAHSDGTPTIRWAVSTMVTAGSERNLSWRK